MHPVLIDLGFFVLPSYGVLLAIAVLVSIWTLKGRSAAAGMESGRIVDLTIWLIIWALVGAKLLLIVVELPRYLRDPGELIGVVRAGGVFLGGFIGALIAVVVLLRRYKLQFLPTADVIVPSLALGHSIGRIGCLLAGCCWGAACELPWAIRYTDPQATANVGTPLHIDLHPFPVYSAIFNLALYLSLAGLFRLRPAPGKVFSTYLIFYGIGRFALEWTRGDTSRGFVLGGMLSTSQLIGLGMVLAGAGLFAFSAKRSRSGQAGQKAK
jgi:phosphatidylglycerol:prolipoprotein diacylglycerol transferase